MVNMIHGMTGDECLEGTQQVPKDWKPCCEGLERSTKSCQYEVRISYFGDKWGMPVLDGGSSFIEIKYCPFCGMNLVIHTAKCQIHAEVDRNIGIEDDSQFLDPQKYTRLLKEFGW